MSNGRSRRGGGRRGPPRYSRFVVCVRGSVFFVSLVKMFFKNIFIFSFNFRKVSVRNFFKLIYKVQKEYPAIYLLLLFAHHINKLIYKLI